MFGLFKSKGQSFNDQTNAQVLRDAGVGVGFWQRDLGWNTSGENPIVSECISLIANSISQLSIHHYKGDVRQKGSHVEKLLRQPNDMTPGSNLIETLVRQVLTNGNGYLYAHRGSNFKVDSIWNASTSTPGINQEEKTLIYSTVSLPSLNTVEQDVPHRLMANVRFKTDIASPLIGQVYADDVSEAIELFNTVLANANKYFSGTGEFENYLTTSMTLTQEQTSKLRERMSELHKEGSVPILTSDMQVKGNPKNYTQSQLNEILHLCRQIIAAAFRVPLPLLSDHNGNSTYKSGSELINNFYNVNLNSYLDVIKVELERLLYIDGFDEELRFDLSAYAEPTSIMEQAQALSMSSWLTLNEKREAMGYVAEATLNDNEQFEAMLVGLGNEPLEPVNDEVEDEVVEEENEA